MPDVASPEKHDPWAAIGYLRVLMADEEMRGASWATETMLEIVDLESLQSTLWENCVHG
jgi:hypothetical protein